MTGCININPSYLFLHHRFNPGSDWACQIPDLQFVIALSLAGIGAGAFLGLAFRDVLGFFVRSCFGGAVARGGQQVAPLDRAGAPGMFPNPRAAAERALCEPDRRTQPSHGAKPACPDRRTDPYHSAKPSYFAPPRTPATKVRTGTELSVVYSCVLQRLTAKEWVRAVQKLSCLLPLTGWKAGAPAPVFWFESRMMLWPKHHRVVSAHKIVSFRMRLRIPCASSTGDSHTPNTSAAAVKALRPQDFRFETWLKTCPSKPSVRALLAPAVSLYGSAPFSLC